MPQGCYPPDPPGPPDPPAPPPPTCPTCPSVSDNLGTMTSKTDGSNLSRRRMLQSAGGFIAATAFPPQWRRGSRRPSSRRLRTGAPRPDVTGRLARYMAGARDRVLPPRWRARRSTASSTHSRRWFQAAGLKPGEMAVRYVRAQGGVPEASVVHHRHPDLRRQRRTGERDVRARRRDRRFRAGDKGASGHARRAGGARRWPSATIVRAWNCSRRDARLRRLLPLAHGARAGSRPRHASKR